MMGKHQSRKLAHLGSIPREGLAARIAQVVERFLGKGEVAGSTPAAGF